MDSFESKMNPRFPAESEEKKKNIVTTESNGVRVGNGGRLQ